MDHAAFSDATTRECTNFLSSRTSLAMKSSDQEALNASIFTQRKRGKTGESICSSSDNNSTDRQEKKSSNKHVKSTADVPPLTTLGTISI